MATAQIAQASIDENGRAKGGMPGDQKPGEVNVKSWYVGNHGGWKELIRCKDTSIGHRAAGIMVQLVSSGLVGYNQNKRNTLWSALEKNGWSPDKYIQSGEKTETDCSAFVFAAYCCVIPHLRELKIGSNSPTCSTSWSVYSKCDGMFDRYTSPEMLSSPDYLQVGDMLNIPGKHIVMVVSTDGTVQVTNAPPVNDVYSTTPPGTSYSSRNASSSRTGSSGFFSGLSNVVHKLSSATKIKPNILVQTDRRKSKFESLLNKMVSDAPAMGRDISVVSPDELYDSNILKNDQESKKENLF